jgi:thioredoxin-dependent peroxiredoxin
MKTDSKEPPMITVASIAPDFTLPRDGGADLTLSALRPGKVVLYFYPKDDTPGCTLEAQDFNARIADFAAAGTTVIGISKDSAKSHDKFCKKYGLGIALVSDETGTTCEDYGVWMEKSMYGKTYMGIERTTVLIDGTGKVAQVWNKVSVKGHADAVLAAAKAL